MEQLTLEALEEKLKGRKVDDLEIVYEPIGGETIEEDEAFVYNVDEDARVHKYWLSSYAKNRVLSNQNYIIL
jgi:hypothetical protein